jgi:type VI secretion system protein ImpG
MDRRLIRYYDRELRHLQSVGREFAKEFPKIAGRLALDDFPCVDPYVERLLEGFAFLASRVQLKIDAEFPRFTQNLLETVYPHYLAPTPSMCITQFQHDVTEAGLAEGYRIPQGTVLRSHPIKEVASCEFRTAHDVELWPIVISEAKYFTRDVGTLELGKVWGAGPDVSAFAARGSAAAMTALNGAGLYLGAPGSVKAAIRIRLRTTAGVPFKDIAAKNLVLHLRGGDSTPYRIYEQLFAHAKAIIARPVIPGTKGGAWQEHMGADQRPIGVSRVGFSAAEAVLPYDDRSFQGYRLLHEYFAFPQRFLFVKLGDLSKAFAQCESQHLDLIIPLSQECPDLEGAIEADNFALHCTPAVNVFAKRADRIFVEENANEFQIIPDRTHPLDFEVYRVNRVTGFATGGHETVFRPFYAATDADALGGSSQASFFSTNRVPRALSDREKRAGQRTSYTGSEVYVSLVDAQSAPFSSDIRQLAVETLCTNRDLPLQMPLGKGKTDFMPDIGGPFTSVRVVVGPTPPRASHAEGDASWRLISHLTLNYLSITDEDQDGDGTIAYEERQGAGSLRELLRIYGNVGDPVVRKQIEGIKLIQARPCTRRVPTRGVVAFARGVEVTVTFEEHLFEGSGIALLGAVLDQFFARYVSMNSFTETVVRTEERGEVMRWNATLGQRPVL